VAVSISAGVANVISVVPDLEPFRVELTVGIIIVMTIINMRGVKESARLFSVPTYFFLFTIALTLIIGFYRMSTGTLGVVSGIEPMHTDVLGPITLLLLLRAFSSGCTALTGIEAISNDTQLFKQPRAKNAAKTSQECCQNVGCHEHNSNHPVHEHHHTGERRPGCTLTRGNHHQSGGADNLWFRRVWLWDVCADHGRGFCRTLHGRQYPLPIFHSWLPWPVRMDFSRASSRIGAADWSLAGG